MPANSTRAERLHTLLEEATNPGPRPVVTSKPLSETNAALFDAVQRALERSAAKALAEGAELSDEGVGLPE